MSRDIRFRAWNKVTETMYDDAINNCKDTFDMVLKHPQIYEVMQYTGLQDKNHVAVYEGDIIKFSDNLHGYISFKEGKFIVNHIECVPVKTQDCGTYLNCYEVIGDIYNNPDILEKVNK